MTVIPGNLTTSLQTNQKLGSRDVAETFLISSVNVLPFIFVFYKKN